MDIQPLNKGFAFLKVDDNMTLHEIRRLRPVPDACLNVDDAFGRRARKDKQRIAGLWTTLAQRLSSDKQKLLLAAWHVWPSQPTFRTHHRGQKLLEVVMLGHHWCVLAMYDWELECCGATKSTR